MNCVLLPLLGLGGRWWQLESICAPTSHIWLAGRESICGLRKSRTCTVVESISKTTPATRSGDVAQRHFHRRHSDFILTKFYLPLNRLTKAWKDAEYSGWHWKVYKCCFMKQKCHIQRGVSQYENASILLSSSGIHTTH